MKTKSALLSVILGLGLALAFILLAQTTAGAAPAAPGGILYVRPGGGAGYYATIQAAVDAAVAGDSILVAQGDYHETVSVSKNLTLQGGWNTSFTAWNWTLYRSTIDADDNGSVISIAGAALPLTVTIEGFYITDGDASGYLGWGGGILAQGAWNDPGLITIRHNYISENVACRLTSCQGYGGGIMIYSNHARIENNAIINNTARTDGRGNGRGGGVAIWGWPTDATLNDNVIEYNTAVISTTGETSAGEGGGLWSTGSGDVSATHNWIRENVAAEKGVGYGGGVYSSGSLYDNEIISNTASIDGAGSGGGVYAYYTPDFHDNLVQGNLASQNAAGRGGGIYAIYLRDARGNIIQRNRATSGGGVFYQEYRGNQRFYQNLVNRNAADGVSLDPLYGGGGIASQADWVEISQNEILTNTGYAGGGVLLLAGDRVSLDDNLIRGNLAYGGGGVFLKDTVGRVARNRIGVNGAIWYGGGIYLAGNSSPELDRNLVMFNTAGGNAGLAGGGVVVAVDAGVHVTLTNAVIALNTINSGVASGIHCYSGACSLIHCTVVDNKLGDNPGEGVRISALGGANVIWNSIIVGHSTGVALGGSPLVSLDYNDYYDNATHVSPGPGAGAHSLFVPPLFVNRAAGNLHLTSSSPLIDAGDSGLSTVFDIDSDPRLSPPDIGADEFIRGRLLLPLMQNRYTPGPHG